ncbi:MAG: ATP-binding protein [Longimicrobiales bacterium]
MNSLRSKILAMYFGLALLPMVLVGAGSYVQSIRSLTSLVQAKLQSAADQSSLEVANRRRVLESSLRILAESRYAERVVRSGRAGSREVLSETARPDPYLWNVVRSEFHQIEFRESSGRVLAVLPGEAETPVRGGACMSGELEAVRVPWNGQGGELVGYVPLRSLLPEELLQVRFGRTGQTLIANRLSGGILYDARCASGAGESIGWVDLSGAVGGHMTFEEDGQEKTAAYSVIDGLPWVVISGVDMDEFTGPYSNAQLLYFGVVILIVAMAGGAFLILAQHFMTSLEELTAAAEQIGEGDLTPWLPPPGVDEVGKLSHAFGTMLSRIKITMQQNEMARQMAVAGGLASQLSHEIRNPLSSIKLNLQSLEREARFGGVPSDLPQVLQLCVREIGRLDDAVNSVLVLGRPQRLDLVPILVDAVVDDSLELLEPRLRRQDIVIERECASGDLLVMGDVGQLSGVFVNLFLNAADAMATGGVLRVVTESGAGNEVRVRVADTGPGIRPESRDMIFQPFFTTKAAGSGIGLPLALQTIRAHGGRLYFEKRSELDPGAEFVVALPLLEVQRESGAGRTDERSAALTVGAA